MGDISIRGRSPLLKGGRVGLKKGGFPIRTTKLKRGADQEFTLQKGVSAAPIKQSRIAESHLYKPQIKKTPAEKRPQWEKDAMKADTIKLDKQIKTVKKVGAGTVGVIAGSAIYGKAKRHLKDKKKKKDKK